MVDIPSFVLGFTLAVFVAGWLWLWGEWGKGRLIVRTWEGEGYWPDDSGEDWGVTPCLSVKTLHRLSAWTPPTSPAP